MILAASLLPHPPLIFPEIGKGNENQIASTIAAYKEAAKIIASLEPDAIVVLSPHSIIYSDYFHISPGNSAAGDFRAYGATGVGIELEYDSELASAIEAGAADENFPAGTLGERDSALDHASMIPLSFIYEAIAGNRPKAVRIGPSGLSLYDHYRFGQIIREAIEKLGRKAVIIASGDLSHKLLDTGPYGFAPQGPDFDQIICEACESGDFSLFLSLKPEFYDEAAECGLRPLCVLAGALDGQDVSSRLLSYEGPFGVGYGVAIFEPLGSNPDRKFREIALNSALGTIKQKSPHAALAYEAIARHVKGMEKPDLTGRADSLLNTQAGCFVTIKEDGQLRGCIGTFLPTKASLALEIIENAALSATQDPRFPALREEELGSIEVTVDVLSAPEGIGSESMLDPERYGVIVTLGGRRGLLLPDLEGVNTIDEQVSIAMQKAGISPLDRPNINLERFEAVRHD